MLTEPRQVCAKLCDSGKNSPIFSVAPDARVVPPVPEALAIERLLAFLFYLTFNCDGKVTHTCATAFDKRRLATFAHGLHANLQPGSTVDINSVTNNKSFKVKVLLVKPEEDYVVLESDEDLFKESLKIRAG